MTVLRRLTDHQLEALADLVDGEWKYGIKIRGRRALPSLRKHGLVSQYYGDGTADQWQITRDGRAVFCKHGTIRHLRPTVAIPSTHQNTEAS